ncbi:zinc finger SWIM domain-containing protein 1 [Apteryx rowi]|uniref:zinc finger SWIM domain-containing protein 1 n=1 Tax=Apteryx rowi TaxID=308060 RepID=UPI000E1D9EE5|nr:zinc finger SWIM domain-containing protein 1 [Apteryx rowi]
MPGYTPQEITRHAGIYSPEEAVEQGMPGYTPQEITRHAGIYSPEEAVEQGMPGYAPLRRPWSRACRDVPWRRSGARREVPPVAGTMALPAAQAPAPARGSRVPYRLGFQSAAMPRVLLVHRALGPRGEALLAFLADGLGPVGGLARVVHLAVPADESAESLACVYTAFKALNPAWREIQTFLVGPDFPSLLALSEAFPAAVVQLSVFHVCKHLQQRIHQLALECRTERLILNALRNTMCAATESNLRKMHTILSHFVKPDLLPQLHVHWLLNDEIWAMHRQRSWVESSDYFKDLEIITWAISQVFCTGLSLEARITSLAKHYQKCVSKSPPDAVMCSTSHPNHQVTQTALQSLPALCSPLAPLTTSAACQGKPSQSSILGSPSTVLAHQKRPVQSSLTAVKNPLVVLQVPLAALQLPFVLQSQPANSQTLLFHNKPGSPQTSLDPSSCAAKLEVTENPEGDSDESNRKTEECIKQSLSDICTEPAARLCLNEFAVVQKSVQLIGTNEDTVNTQVLEDAHKVDQKGLNNCTCHFNQTLQLPCRHILAVLHSDRKTLQPEMLSKQWQKGRDACRAGRDGTDGLLEVLKSSWNESLDKSLAVSFLTAEISRLLTHCSSEEFERRYNALRELADSWIGPYVQVKL